MKKNLFLFLLSLIVVVNYSCKKDNTETENTSAVEQNSSGLFKYSSDINLSDINEINGILQFQNTDKVNYILDQLDAQCDFYWDSIINQYGDLNDDEFNDLLDSLGIDEDKPLIDFENHFNFYSLRKEIKVGESEWLALPYPDCCLDPDDHFVIDETTRTIMNAGGEIIIGSTIYKFYYNGTIVQIDSLDFTLLTDVNRVDTAGLDSIHDPNFSYYYKAGQDLGEPCRGSKKKKEFEVSGNRRIKAVIKIGNMPWGGSVKAKTKNYKKKKGKWKIYRAMAYARVQGKVYDGECTFKTNVDNYTELKKNKVKVKVKFSNNAIKTKSGEMKSYHDGAGGVSKTLVLDQW